MPWSHGNAFWAGLVQVWIVFRPKFLAWFEFLLDLVSGLPYPNYKYHVRDPTPNWHIVKIPNMALVWDYCKRKLPSVPTPWYPIPWKVKVPVIFPCYKSWILTRSHPLSFTSLIMIRWSSFSYELICIQFSCMYCKQICPKF